MPPSAASKRPSRRPAAPVNEPFSCPNSSLSSSVSESAAHDTLMNGLSLRGDCSWSACADQLFSGARFAQHQHRGLGGRGPLHHLEHRLQLGRLADDALQPVALAHPLAQPGRLGLQAPLLHRLVEHHQHRVEIERLEQVALGAGAHRLDRVGDGAEGRHHHEGGGGAHPLGFAKSEFRRASASAHRRARSRRLLRDRLQRGLAIRRLGDLVSLLGEQRAQPLRGGFVVNDEDAILFMWAFRRGPRLAVPKLRTACVDVPAARESFAACRSLESRTRATHGWLSHSQRKQTARVLPGGADCAQAPASLRAATVAIDMMLCCGLTPVLVGKTEASIT